VRTLGCSVRVDQRNGILCAPGQPFDALLSADCEQFVLRIDPAALAAQTGTATPRFAPLVPVGGLPLRSWMQQLQLVAGSPELLACARGNPRVALQLERLLIDLLMAGHAAMEPAGAAATRRTSVSPGFVRRAQDFIDANCAEPLQLPDISLAAGVPERTLRDGFQQFKGVSPMQYLRRLRLERARDALRNAPADVRVADIALDCGFSHLGRFALAYREKFGESPSDTLRRR
jgi:AraC-like DNA-binding protein